MIGRLSNLKKQTKDSYEETYALFQDSLVEVTIIYHLQLKWDEEGESTPDGYQAVMARVGCPGQKDRLVDSRGNPEDLERKLNEELAQMANRLAEDEKRAKPEVTFAERRLRQAKQKLEQVRRAQEEIWSFLKQEDESK